MKKLLAKIRKLLRDRRTRQIITRFVSITAAIVVFVTTYALVLPAITMESEAYCGIPAHQHSDECYELQLVCGLEESPGHHHDDSCYTVKQVLVCETEEHQHDQDCYDEAGELVCTKAEHTHNADGECYEEERVLTCEEVESEGHQHTEDCYEKVLTCGLEVHTHSTECYVNPASDGATNEAAVEVSSGGASTGAASVDNSDVEYDFEDAGENSNTGATDASENATTALTTVENATAGVTADGHYVPQLNPVNFPTLLDSHTGIYYHSVADGETVEDSTSIPADGWTRVDNDTELGVNDLLRVYLAYTVPAGSLNTTNQVARYRLPGNLHLTDAQVNAINSNVNGIAGQYVDMSTLEILDVDKYNAYLGIEAVEGTRRPDEDPEEYLADVARRTGNEAAEYISALVRVEDVFDEHSGEYEGTDLVVTFTPYSVEKNQHEYDTTGQPIKAGQEIQGWLTLDFNLSQADWDETTVDTFKREVETEEADDHSVEEQTVDDEAEEAEEAGSAAVTVETVERIEKTADVVFVAEDRDEKNHKIDEISTKLTVVEETVVGTQTVEDQGENAGEGATEDAVAATTEEAAVDDQEQANTGETSDESTTGETSAPAEEDKSDAAENAEPVVIMPAMSFNDKITVRTGKPADIETNAGGTLANAAESLPEEAEVTVRVEADEGTFPAGTTMVLKAVDQKTLDGLADTLAETVENPTDVAASSESASSAETTDSSDNEKAEETEQTDSTDAAVDDHSEANEQSEQTVETEKPTEQQTETTENNTEGEKKESNLKTYGFQAVDITFVDAEGNEVEPAKLVRVALTSETVEQAKKEAENSSVVDPVVVHVDDEGNAEQMDLVAPEEIEPAVGRSEEEIERDLEAEKAAGSDVSDVNDEADTEGSDTTDTASTADAVETDTAANNDGAASDTTVDNDAAKNDDAVSDATVDDHTVDNDVEASETDNTYEDAQTNTGDGGNADADVTDAATDSSTVGFTTDSFSVYAIVYTVDFHYDVDGKTYDYSINGGDVIGLKELLPILNVITDDEATENVDEVQTFINDIESVQFSDESLVKVARISEDTTVGELKEALDLHPEYSEDLTEEQLAEMDGKELAAPDWALVSLKAFQSDETLTVSMKSGEVFEIKVTDLNENPFGLNGKSFKIVNSSNAMTTNDDGTIWRTGHMFLPDGNISNGETWTFEYTGTGTQFIIKDAQNRYLLMIPQATANSTSGLVEGLQMTTDRTLAETYPVVVKETIDSNGKRGYAFLNSTSEYCLSYDYSRFYLDIVDYETNKTEPRYCMELRNPSDTSKPGLINTADTRSEGITINLFDYYANNYQGYDILDEEANVYSHGSGSVPGTYNIGINQGHDLKFTSHGQDPDENNDGYAEYNTSINSYSEPTLNNGNYVAVQGIVQSELDSYGYPVLATNSKESLKYLFDLNNINGAKTAYNDLNHLFIKDEKGYYRYNSNENYAYYNTGSSNTGRSFDVYAGTFNEEGTTSQEAVGFFPFNDYDSYYDCIHGGYYPDRLGNFIYYGSHGQYPNNQYPYPGRDKIGHYNHQFGMSLEADFIMTPDGKYLGDDIQFNFSGDDDLWVFVDGVLVLDIGGVHNPVTGQINFNTGIVTVRDEVHNIDPAQMVVNGSQAGPKTIKEAFERVTGKEWDDSPYTKHTLKVFYLERGGMYSNLAISFNLPTYKTITVEKELKGLTETQLAQYNNEYYYYQVKVNGEPYTGPYGVLTRSATQEELASWVSEYITYDDGTRVYIGGHWTDPDHTKTETINKNGELVKWHVDVENGIVRVKPGWYFTIEELTQTDTFSVAELYGYDSTYVFHDGQPDTPQTVNLMAPFYTPLASYSYKDANNLAHNEVLPLTETVKVDGSKTWGSSTKPLQYSDRVKFINSLTTALTVSKVWSESDVNVDHSTDTITFKLYQVAVNSANEIVSEAEYTGSYTNTITGSGTVTIGNLPQVGVYGVNNIPVTYQYYVVEDHGKEGYIQEITHNELGNAWTITNIAPSDDDVPTHVDITKKWLDKNNNDVTATAHNNDVIQVKLIQRAVENGFIPVKLKLYDGGSNSPAVETYYITKGGTFTFTAIKAATLLNHSVTVRTDRASDTTTTKNGENNVFTFTNITEPLTITAKLNYRGLILTGYDRWGDQANYLTQTWAHTTSGTNKKNSAQAVAEAVRNNTVAIPDQEYLYELHKASITDGPFEESASGWAGTINGLPLYKKISDGTYYSYYYTIDEVSINGDAVTGKETTGNITTGYTDDYTVTINGDTLTVTNKEREKINIDATKAWVNASNQQMTPADGTAVTFDVFVGETALNKQVTLNGKTDVAVLSTDPTVAQTQEVNAGALAAKAYESAAWKALWTDLPKYNANGTLIQYTVKEISCPNGFENQTIAGVNSGGTITNKQTTIDISFVKTDGSGNGLEGAKFQLLVDKGTTTANYVLVKPSTGYTAGYEGIRFNDGTAEAVDIELTTVYANEKTPGTGVPYESGFVTSDQTMTLKNMPDGKYKLVEVDAPDGYVILANEIYFEISNGVVTSTTASNASTSDKVHLNTTGTTAVLTVDNTPGFELPSSGGPGTRLIYLAGAMFTSIGILLLYRGRRRIRT